MGSRSSIGCLSGAAKIAALFVAILFLFVLPISIFALDIGGVFFSPESLSSAVVASVTGSQVGQQFITDEIMPNLVSGTAPTDQFDFTRSFSDLDQADRDQIVSLLVPEDWLEKQISHAVEALIRWIDEDQAQLVFKLEIQPLKDALLRGGSEQVLEIIVDSWPPCNLEQMGIMGMAADEQGQVPVLYCEPPEPFRTELLEFANNQLLVQIEQIPTEVEVGADQPGSDDLENQMEVKQSLRTLRALSQTMWFLAVGLLGLIMALAIRSWSELSRWWGIPIMLGGLTTLIWSISLNQRGSGFLLDRLPQLQSGEGPLREMITLLISGLIDSVVGTIQLHSLFIGAVGLAIFLAGWFLGRNRRDGSYVAVNVASQPRATYDPYRGAGQSSQQWPPPEAPETDKPTDRRDNGERPSGIFG